MNADSVLAAVLRRILGNEDVYIDTEQGWLTIDGGTEVTADEAALIDRLWRTAHNIPATSQENS